MIKLGPGAECEKRKKTRKSGKTLSKFSKKLSYFAVLIPPRSPMPPKKQKKIPKICITQISRNSKNKVSQTIMTADKIDEISNHVLTGRFNPYSSQTHAQLCMLNAVNNALRMATWKYKIPGFERISKDGQHYDIHFDVEDMNVAFDKVVTEYGNAWIRNKVLTEKDVNNKTMKFTKLVENKIGKPTTGPVCMRVIQLMLQAKQLTLRLLHKPVKGVDPMSSKVQYLFDVDVKEDQRSLQNDTLWMDKYDIDTIRASRMVCILFLFKVSSKENIKLTTQMQQQYSDINDTTKLDIINFRKQSEAQAETDKGKHPAHCVACPGDETVISDSQPTFKAKSSEAIVDVVYSSALNRDALRHMISLSKEDDIDKCNLGMFAYEIIPTRLLQQRIERNKTKHAEALLHEKNVVGCLVKRNNLYTRTIKSDPNQVNSVCILPTARRYYRMVSAKNKINNKRNRKLNKAKGKAIKSTKKNKH